MRVAWGECCNPSQEEEEGKKKKNTTRHCKAVDESIDPNPTNVLSRVDVGRVGRCEVRDEVLEGLPQLDDSRRVLWRVFVDNQVGGQSDALARVQVVVATAVHKRSGVVSDEISVSISSVYALGTGELESPTENQGEAETRA